MKNERQAEPYIERVDDLPVLFGLLQQMRIQVILDNVIRPHGNWQDALCPDTPPVRDAFQHNIVSLERLTYERGSPFADAWL